MARRSGRAVFCSSAFSTRWVFHGKVFFPFSAAKPPDESAKSAFRQKKRPASFYNGLWMRLKWRIPFIFDGKGKKILWSACNPLPAMLS